MTPAVRQILFKRAPVPLPVFERARTQRIDIVGLSDSNQLQNGFGWDHGIQYALSQYFPMYATGIMTQNENGGSGAGMGYLYTRGTLVGAVTGAPAELEVFLDKGAGGLFPPDYTFVADGNSVTSTANMSFALLAACPLDVTAALDFDFYYGTFDSGSGAFKPTVRLEQSPFTVIATIAAISTNDGAFALQRATVSIAADATRVGKQISGRWTQPGVTGITGPFFGLWMRASNPAIQYGFSYHTLDYRGSQSTRTLAVDLQEASDETLTGYFTEVRRLQGASKYIVIMVNSGLNDRNETVASVGPGAVVDADSPEAFVDNLTAIVERVQAIWTLNAWSQDELHFVFMPSHPISTPDDAELLTYRSAAKVYAATLSQASVIDLGDRAPAPFLSAKMLYLNPVSDTSHLNQTGYEQAGLRAVTN